MLQSALRPEDNQSFEQALVVALDKAVNARNATEPSSWELADKTVEIRYLPTAHAEGQQ